MKRFYTKLLRSALAGGLLPGALIGVAAAQNPKWSTPTLGFVFDAESKSIRPMRGVVGAASLESGVAIPTKLANASLSPNGRLALAEDPGSDHLLLVRWDAQAGTADALETAPNAADLIAWSPDGSVVAAYNAAQQQVWVWKSLDSDPVLAQQSAAAELRALAVADDGTLVASTDSALLRLASEPAQIAAVGYSALAFAPNSLDLVAADSVLNELVIYKGLASDARLTLATAADGIGQPNGVGFSRDGSKIVVTNASAKSALLIESASGAHQLFPCDCTPDGVFGAQGNAVFRLTNTGQKRITLLDADSSEARLLAIPVGGRQ